MATAGPCHGSSCGLNRLQPHCFLRFYHSSGGMRPPHATFAKWVSIATVLFALHLTRVGIHFFCMMRDQAWFGDRGRGVSLAEWLVADAAAGLVRLAPLHQAAGPARSSVVKATGGGSAPLLRRQVLASIGAAALSAPPSVLAVGPAGASVPPLTPAGAASERLWLDVPAREVVVRSEAVVSDALQGWSKLVAGGGDAVRRVLGTVGVNSPLYALRKALRTLAAEDPDLLEASEELQGKLRQADFLAYSANFAMSSGSACPDSGDSADEGYVGRRKCDEMYLDQARVEVEALLTELRNLKSSLAQHS